MYVCMAPFAHLWDDLGVGHPTRVGRVHAADVSPYGDASSSKKLAENGRAEVTAVSLQSGGNPYVCVHVKNVCMCIDRYTSTWGGGGDVSGNHEVGKLQGAVLREKASTEIALCEIFLCGVYVCKEFLPRLFPVDSGS